jgi:hypothetical protein
MIASFRRAAASRAWAASRALAAAVALAVLCAVPGIATEARAQSAAPAATFSNEQLDQMLAPIALYPDSLLSQLLMACTYPADVAEAVAWSKANPSQKGDAAVTAVQSKPWDPSVASLVAFPQVLAMAGERPDWVQSVGDAFLADPEGVMNSIQRLRAQAQKAGNLQTTEQQKVIVEPAPQAAPQAAAPTQTIIRIEPASPQVVYVPAYNPTVVYGTWMYPSYPPYYWPTPGYAFGNALARGIAFGTGVAITNAIWGGFNWGRNDIDINVNRYNNINVNKKIDVDRNSVKWEHNAGNRKGVPYRDDRSREKYSRQTAGAADREAFRGKDAGSRDAARERAQASVQQRTGTGAGRTRDGAAGVDPDRARAAAQDVDRSKVQAAARDRDVDPARAKAQVADRDAARANAKVSADSALKGAGNGAQTRQHVDRGKASREAASRPAARPAAKPAARPAAKPAARPAGGGGHARARAR